MAEIWTDVSGARLLLRSAFLTGLVLVFSVLAVSQSQAWSPERLDWSGWDTAHAVARKETWMVIREPGRDACFLKQGYAGEKMMDMTVDESGTPCLWGPFSPDPVDVRVRYRIDDMIQGEITAAQVTNGIRLPRKLVQTMRRGFLMRVEVESVDPEVQLGTVKSQEFSLLGFIAATEVLHTGACGK